jgi:hypothetical protein
MEAVTGEATQPDRQSTTMLLDCEVIALSMRAERLWPSVTPTVDRSNEDDVRTAIDRGISSLVVRGLVVEGEERPRAEVLGATTPVLEGDPILAIFVGSPRMEIDTTFSATVCYELDPVSVEETITPDGIHYLRVLDVTACYEQAARFIDDLAERGMDQLVGESAPDRRLWFVGPPSSDAVRTVMVEGREAVSGFTPVESSEFEPEGPVTSGSAAIAFLRGIE